MRKYDLTKFISLTEALEESIKLDKIKEREGKYMKLYQSKIYYPKSKYGNWSFSTGVNFFFSDEFIGASISVLGFVYILEFYKEI